MIYLGPEHGTSTNGDLDGRHREALSVERMCAALSDLANERMPAAIACFCRLGPDFAVLEDGLVARHGGWWRPSE